MPSLPRQLVIGEILRPHGVRGEVRMRVHSQDPQALQRLRYIYLADKQSSSARERVELLRLRFNKTYALLSLSGYARREQAEALRGKLVYCDLEQLPPLDEGEYFLFQLHGLQVIADGVEIGRIRDVLETGANDVYILESADYGELLIPAHEETIEQIDFASGVIHMSLPEGLLPQN
ncbi:MAG: ribosome maturation factor RimM [Chloroflexi bacterium]|nr:ribosome maturation factor RimM [Chloroflexota bacterium]MCY3583184.1 ribosome maturation factor RimM [Chloroflexota bacterium]MCY3716044.1 ribosome maturation factor RimM [Chloroflexota bacterium]MDE2651365.1 ribosome maturation factor RimM [Chloroflexota bacterium]